MFQTMKTKAAAFMATAKPKMIAFAKSAAQKWPAPCGFAVGYFGHGAIHFAASAAMSAAKLMFKL